MLDIFSSSFCVGTNFICSVFIPLCLPLTALRNGRIPEFFQLFVLKLQAAGKSVSGLIIDS